MHAPKRRHLVALVQISQRTDIELRARWRDQCIAGYAIGSPERRGISGGQRTVVTEIRGDLEGQRVVRGREVECLEYYQSEQGKQVVREANTAVAG